MSFPNTAVQTSVASSMPKGYEGMLADINPKSVDTGIVEEANGMKFGRAVIRGTTGDQMKLPRSASDKIRGVTIASKAFVADVDGSVTMPVESTGSILRDGNVYVQPVDAVNRDGQAYVIYKVPEQVSTLTFDANLVADNTIDLKVNGSDMTQITYDTSHANTMSLIAAQLVVDFPLLIKSAVVDGQSLEIISQDGTEITISDITVAAGASQANGSWAQNRAYDPTQVPGRFKSDTGEVAGIVNTAYAVAVSNWTFEEDATAKGIAKLRVK